MTDIIREALKVALDALEGAQGNINPERGFADEVETEIAAAVEQARAALALPTSTAQFVALPVEPSETALTSMSVALGIKPLSDGTDGSYPISGAQSTVRQCYDALVDSLRTAD